MVSLPNNFLQREGFVKVILYHPTFFLLSMECLSHIIRDVVSSRNWSSLKFGRNGTILSHIFFTDDIVLFDESSSEQMEIILECLNKFCVASKSKVSV